MTTEPYNKLEQVRTLLKQLGNGVASLAQNYADILDSPNLQDALSKFRQAYEESVTRLENPNFTIATIGTTSSGKSTIVNALIGRKIAPIEAGEMSGGILTIKHSKEFKLFVADTENAQWETGTWTDLSDRKIYDCIRNGVMFPYHQARQKQELIAPQVTACVPILPAEDPSLLGLPEGIGIEFIDLPGLKSIQDKDNLKVIQQQVNKAFSLVALDYLQVDDRHRKRLLEELKKVVEFFQGRTDSMIFILNRVDQRGQDDIAIADRIYQLQLEIQETLSLVELPDIIPLSGRLLYYAQCAWGATAINSNSNIDASTRQQLLNNMLVDCAGLIKLNTKQDKKLKRWFTDLEDRIDDGEIIDDESMRKVIYHIYDWSGGDKLWQCMRDRVSESFSELVILPALIEVLNLYEVLVSAIDVELKIKKIREKKEIEDERQNIIDGREKLAVEVKNLRTQFQQEVKKRIEVLKQKNEQARSRLERRSIEGFDSFYDTVRQVEEDLLEHLISSVRNAFEQDKGTYELEEELANVVSLPKAKAIAKAYDLVNHKLNKFERDETGCFIIQARHDNKEKIRSMEHAEKAVRILYYAMRQAMTARAEFTLQGKVKQLETGLLSLVSVPIEKLKIFCHQIFSKIDLDKAIAINFEISITQNPPKLPIDIFNFSVNIEQNTTSKREVVGQNQETEYYTEGSCFKQHKSKNVTKNIYGDIEYRELKLPDYKEMARQWADGIASEKQKFWDALNNWINEYLEQITNEFENNLEKETKSSEIAFDKQLKAIEKNELVKEEYWKKFKQNLNLVTEIHQQIRQSN
ncbi:dynamin family protein [Myxosarcina sp. GI1]|uniref:dynamin family protein n=1 Tax=Myxosarcina sp. GI1 TaxID=1541065 RepID=UPI0005688C0A|nr:dynamin family protein [Myxosarcina sp. GI1]